MQLNRTVDQCTSTNMDDIVRVQKIEPSEFQRKIQNLLTHQREKATSAAVTNAYLVDQHQGLYEKLLRNNNTLRAQANAAEAALNYDSDGSDFDLQPVPILQPIAPIEPVLPVLSTPQLPTGVYENVIESSSKLVALSTKTICSCEQIDSNGRPPSQRQRIKCLLDSYARVLYYRNRAISEEQRTTLLALYSIRLIDLRKLTVIPVTTETVANNNSNRAKRSKKQQQQQQPYQPTLTTELAENRFVYTFLRKFLKTHPLCVDDGPSLVTYHTNNEFYNSI
jgi:hypothetical protein